MCKEASLDKNINGNKKLELRISRFEGLKLLLLPVAAFLIVKFRGLHKIGELNVSSIFYLNPNTNSELPSYNRGRGKHISNMAKPEELYDIYQEVRDDYDVKAFGCDENTKSFIGEKKKKEKCVTNWKILREEGDIVVSMLQHPNDPTCPYVKISATMPGAVQDVWDFLGVGNWPKLMPKMDPFFEGFDLIEKHSIKRGKRFGLKKGGVIDIVLGRKRTKRLLTFGKRDFTFIQVSDVPREDGLWISGTVSVTTNKLPRVKGYTRAFQDSMAFYKELPYDENTDGTRKTEITVIFRIDLNDSAEDGQGGNIPMWMYTKTVGKTGIFSMTSMRKEIQKEIGYYNA